MNKQRTLFESSLHLMSSHVQAHAKRQKSKVEQEYSKAMLNSTAALKTLAAEGDFDTILQIELTLQQQDLEKYSKSETVRQNVLDGIEDIEKGLADHKTLMESPETYRIKAYVKRDMAGPGKTIPLDAMRKALRSQTVRVRNYARNPMANDAERAFHTARMTLIRRAEKLYEGI